MKFKKLFIFIIMAIVFISCESGFEDMMSDANNANAALQSVRVTNTSTSDDIGFNFSRGVTSYTVNVGKTLTVDVMPVPVKNDSIVRYRTDDGITWSSLNGDKISLVLTMGVETILHINVTAADGNGNVQYSFNLISAIGIPSVTTSIVSDINSKTATGGGSVTDDGGYPVSTRGICWNTTGDPTISDSKTSDGSGAGVYTSAMSGLTAGGTTYYVRAYATSSAGTGYGGVVSLKTCGYTGPPGWGICLLRQGELF